jgi:hypothetical protein
MGKLGEAETHTAGSSNSCAGIATPWSSLIKGF